MPTPCWDAGISQLFTQPFWIEPSRQPPIAAQWLGCMSGYGLQLNQYESVKQHSVLIYQWLYNRQMPLTADTTQFWPDEALEMFRTWVNQGWRRMESDKFDPADRIALPAPRPVPVRLRRDLASFTPQELDDYRMRFDDAFQVANAAPDAPGQIFFGIHNNWCLHYQEAFLLWHRAYLLAFEQALGCAVPYWNWYAEYAAVDGAPGAGLPQAFKDLTYIHPRTGEMRPNPLRFAAAWNGRSKACTPSDPGGIDCFYVQRDSVLYTEGDDHRVERTRKIGLTLNFQLQVQRALAFTDFSHPQGIGYPWANIQRFDPPPPDADYVYRNYNFDGAYEQPHDNYHGWVGPDMADNAYTAFDPVFWSYHANIDRIFESWLRANSATMTVTSNFPLHPFTGAQAAGLDYADKRRFMFTTIGDMTKDSRALGFDFAPPVQPDFGSQPVAGRQCPMPGHGGTKPQAAALAGDELLVVFDDVRCTLESYAIDAFINQPEAGMADVDAENPHYAGRVARVGMGQADDKGRCITEGVRRILDATGNARRLGFAPGAPIQLTLLVTELATGAAVAPEVQAELPGFAGQAVWTHAGWATGLAPKQKVMKSCH